MEERFEVAARPGEHELAVRAAAGRSKTRRLIERTRSRAPPRGKRSPLQREERRRAIPVAVAQPEGWTGAGAGHDREHLQRRARVLQPRKVDVPTVGAVDEVAVPEQRIAVEVDDHDPGRRRRDGRWRSHAMVRLSTTAGSQAETEATPSARVSTKNT